MTIDDMKPVAIQAELNKRKFEEGPVTRVVIARLDLKFQFFTETFSGGQIDCLQCYTDQRGGNDEDPTSTGGGGTTYNSYVITDGVEVALIDAAPLDAPKDYIDYIDSIAATKTIKYLILQHADSHHVDKISQFSPQLIAKIGTVVATPAAFSTIGNKTKSIKKMTVTDETPLKLGTRTLIVKPIRDLHTADTMVTLDNKTKVLYTCDAFAAHFIVREDNSVPPRRGARAEYVIQKLSAPPQISNNFVVPFRTFYGKVLYGIPGSDSLSKLTTYVENLLNSKSLLAIAPGHGPCLLAEKLALKTINNTYKLPPSGQGFRSIVFGIITNGEFGTIFNNRLVEAITTGVTTEAGFVEDLTETLDLETATDEQIQDLVSRAAGVVVTTPPVDPEALAALEAKFRPVTSKKYVSLVQISDSDSASTDSPQDYTDLFRSIGATTVSSPVQIVREVVIRDGERGVFEPVITAEVFDQLRTLGSDLAESALRKAVFAIIIDSDYEFSEQLVGAIREGVVEEAGINEETQILDLKTASFEEIQDLVSRSAGIIVTTPSVGPQASAALGVVLLAVKSRKYLSLVQISDLVSVSGIKPRDYTELFRATGAIIVSSPFTIVRPPIITIPNARPVPIPTITQDVIDQLKTLGRSLAKSALRKAVFAIFIDSDYAFTDQVVQAIGSGVGAEAGINESTEHLDLKTATFDKIQDLVSRSAGIVVTTSPVGREATAALGVVLAAVTTAKYLSLVQISDSSSTEMPRDYTELFRATGATIVSPPVQVIGPTITQDDIDRLKTLGNDLADSALRNVKLT